YTEKTIFSEFLEALEEIAPLKRNITVLIKLHPKEDADSFSRHLINIPKGLRIVIDKDTEPRKLILASDLVCGMSSMFLLESIIIGKPTLSVQIGLCRPSPFVLERMKILSSIRDQKSLRSYLESIILHKQVQEYKFSVVSNAVKNVINLVEDICAETCDKRLIPIQ
ncbi:MAG: hypothetical protein WA125_10685, partial [Desulfosporosinus sp.]